MSHDLLSPAELVAGARRLEVGADGRPVNPLVLVDLDATMPDAADADAVAARGVVVGVTTARSEQDLDDLVARLHLTTVVTPDLVDEVHRAVHRAPLAAVTLAGLLSITSSTASLIGVTAGLLAESFAYSTLLAGPEFAAWRLRTPARPVPADSPGDVLVERVGDVLTITLNRPERHNAFSRALRDGVIDALAVARADRDLRVVLRGAGRSFSSGGDLDEFGTTSDPVHAHVVRAARSAGLAVHEIRDRVTAELHGACVGAGIEVPSFAGTVVARPDAWFQLPELAMGLVPGAGGTISITRRIGRRRTAWLALTGRRIDAATALEWGLVDRVV